MSSNIICPSPNKSVAPSEKVEKGSNTLDEIEEPVVTIHQKNLDKKSRGEYPKTSPLRGSLQDQIDGSILIIGG